MIQKKQYNKRWYNIPISVTLSLSLLINACNGQVKTDPVKENTSKPGSIAAWGPSDNPLDKDRYFIENKDSISSYGHRGITRNIIQDKSDNIWFASYTGIVQFKDNKFTNFTNLAGLRRYRIFSVFEDQAGNIWFGTVGAGVYRYNGTTFINYTTRDGLADDKVECMTTDKKGNIWFGTGNGVSRFDGKKFHNFSTEDGLVNADIHAIIEDRSGKIWVAALGGVFSYEPNSMIKENRAFVAFNNNTGMPFNNVRSIIEDKKGNLWFGGQDGLYRYDGQSVNNYMKSFTGNLYADNKGNIWCSVGSGDNNGKMQLYRFAADAAILAFTNSTPVKKEDGLIFGITEDRKGNIWFGTLGGACCYDGKTFNYFRKNEVE